MLIIFSGMRISATKRLSPCGLSARPLRQRLIAPFLFVAILLVQSGCDYERYARPVHSTGDAQQWKLNRVSLPVAVGIDLEDERRLLDGGPSSMHWSPDNRAVAWIEKGVPGENLRSNDVFVIRWMDDGREERIALPASNVISFGWSRDSQRIVLESSRVPETEKRRLSELLIGIKNVEVVDIDLPSIHSPRSPAYWNEDDDIAFVFEGQQIGLYERSTGRVVRQKRGNYFANKMVCADDGLALAEIPMSPGRVGRFVYLKNPFKRTATTFKLIDSQVKPILLASPSGESMDVTFVAYDTTKRNSGVIYGYRTENNVLTRHLELSAVFGSFYTIKGIAASVDGGYIGFIVDSESPKICGTWIASISTGELWQIGTYPSNVISLSDDGKWVFFQNAAASVQISSLDALAK